MSTWAAAYASGYQDALADVADALRARGAPGVAAWLAKAQERPGDASTVTLVAEPQPGTLTPLARAR